MRLPSSSTPPDARPDSAAVMGSSAALWCLCVCVWWGGETECGVWGQRWCVCRRCREGKEGCGCQTQRRMCGRDARAHALGPPRPTSTRPACEGDLHGRQRPLRPQPRTTAGDCRAKVQPSATARLLLLLARHWQRTARARQGVLGARAGWPSRAQRGLC
jgi:hypothetical protein